LTVIAMLGPSDSEIDQYADLTLRTPGTVPGIIQQGHITLGHALCAGVEQLLGRITHR
jgi:phosphoheptose isomerase